MGGFPKKPTLQDVKFCSQKSIGLELVIRETIQIRKALPATEMVTDTDFELVCGQVIHIHRDRTT